MSKSQSKNIIVAIIALLLLVCSQTLPSVVKAPAAPDETETTTQQANSASSATNTTSDSDEASSDQIKQVPDATELNAAIITYKTNANIDSNADVKVQSVEGQQGNCEVVLLVGDETVSANENGTTWTLTGRDSGIVVTHNFSE